MRHAYFKHFKSATSQSEDSQNCSLENPSHIYVLGFFDTECDVLAHFAKVKMVLTEPLFWWGGGVK